MTRALAFLRPETIDEAVALLQEHEDEAKIVAGSTGLTIITDPPAVSRAAR